MCVIHGLEVIDKLAAVGVGVGDRPAKHLSIKITVKRMLNRDIERKFQFLYSINK